jgi:hypothetical protein
MSQNAVAMLLGGIDEVTPKEIYIRAETNIFRACIKSSVAISDTIPFRILQVRGLEKGQGIVFPNLPKSSVSGSYRHFSSQSDCCGRLFAIVIVLIIKHDMSHNTLIE